MWRQTGGCDPNGPHESRNDRRCREEVPAGSSGYCECLDGSTPKTSTCEHVQFRCSDFCSATSPEGEKLPVFDLEKWADEENLVFAPHHELPMIRTKDYDFYVDAENILRILGRERGLYGMSGQSATEIDMIMGITDEVREAYFHLVYIPEIEPPLLEPIPPANPTIAEAREKRLLQRAEALELYRRAKETMEIEKRAGFDAAKAKFMHGKLLPWAAKLNQELEARQARGLTYLAGEGFSVADLYVFDTLSLGLGLSPSCLDGFKALADLFVEVGMRDEISMYLSSPKRLPHPNGEKALHGNANFPEDKAANPFSDASS